MGSAGDAIVKDFGPDDVAIAFDDGVGASKFDRFVRVESSVDAAINDPSTTFARNFADFIAA